MDLIDDQRVRRLNIAVLKPASRDAGRDDHDVPRRRLRRRFTLPVHDTGLQLGRPENRFGDGTNGQGLAGTRARHDAEALSTRREASQIVAACAFEERVEVQADREFDRLARRARRRDDDDAPSGRLGRNKGVAVGGEVTITWSAHPRNLLRLRAVTPLRPDTTKPAESAERSSCPLAWRSP